MSKNLDFRIQRQVLSNWCWAATVASIADFYNDPSYGSQCKLVSRLTNLGDCCESVKRDGENSVCNQAHDLGGALWDCNHGVRVNPDPPKWDKIVAEIEKERPAACNVLWEGGGAHAMVISGYTDEGMLQIADPEKPGTHVSINRDFVYSATYGSASKNGRIEQIFRTKGSK
jgi:hypothetical protein